jgi:4-amino-4-deoxy-L-arabinose transferase-like glycosyltransferase
VEEYSTFTDELLSAIVAKSIGQNGIPLLPSNTIYDRAFLHHYLLAIPIGLFGINFISMRINSILLSSLTIWIIYLLGVRVANRRVAIAAALFLALNSIFNLYSLSGRMYMTYGCFYILSIYFFYRGFVEDKAGSKIFSIFFMIATMLSSEAGLIIGPIFVFLCYFYNRNTWYKDKVIILGCAAWILIAYLILFYRIPGSYSAFTAHAGSLPGTFLDYKWPLKELMYHMSYLWRVLDGCIPFSVPFFIVMTGLVAKKRQLKDHFPLMALLPALIMQSIFLHYGIQKRVIVSIAPLYILTCCQLFFTLWNWVTAGLKKEGSFKRFIVGRTKQVTIAVVVFSLISVPLIIDKYIIDKYLMHPTGFPTYLFKPFYDHRSRMNPEPSYLYVKKHAKKKDVIIQTTLEYGLFFLGDEYNHHYLRQKKGRDADGNRIYMSFTKKNEPYYGRPLIDSIESLKNLMANSQNNIWLILGEKSKWSVGPELKEFIRNHFQLKFSKNEFKVYSFNN